MDEVTKTTFYDESSDRVLIKHSYDPSEVLGQNQRLRNAASETTRYKGNLCHVGSIHEGDVIRLQNMGYNLLSADPDETRRALCYIQTSEPHLLTVPGKPFARVRPVWG